MNINWIVLNGEEQTGEFAQLLISSDTSIPKPESPWPDGRATPRPEGFIPISFPVIKSTTFAPVLPDLISVQPMTSSGGDIFPFEFITSEERKRRDAEFRAEVEASIGPDEILKEYHYGGVLSERGGYFVVNKNDPKKVLRFYQTCMS